MTSKKFMIACLLIAAGFFFTNQALFQTGEFVGILQTATHPALDRVRVEFMDELNRLNPEIKFVVQNAQGSVSNANSIAELFHAQKKIRAIFAIGTPAVQAAARAEKQKPILISAVSDPQSLDLGSNVCGTTDRIDTDQQASWIAKMAITKVAILHNPSEANSQVMVKRMQRSLKEMNIESFLFNLHSENEIAQTVAAAAQKGEAILLPTDNLCASALPLIAKEAKKRLVIASDITLVDQGAHAAQGVDYGTLGKITAGQAHQVLSGILPEEIGFADPEEMKTIVKELKL